MNCVTHPAVPAAAYCRICGRAMCTDCKRELHGTVYCEACLARERRAPVPGVPIGPGGVGPQGGPIPGLALGLGFIPGVGAIYNGQYAKGFVHIVIFATLINMVSSPEARGFEPLIGLMIPTFIFYMAFEAFHTARKHSLGEPVDEWSGLFSASTESGASSRSGQAGATIGVARSGGAIVLIAIGVLILLSNLGYLHLSQILRWWPLLLIGIGASMLVNRLAGDGPRGPQGGN
jgi:hypothetical protein